MRLSLARRSARILLVEDNEFDAERVRDLLAGRAADELLVCRCTRLAEAVTRLREQQYDVALVDLSLPDSRGLETVRRLRGASRELPIVVMTGKDDHALALDALQAGAQDYVVKWDAEGRTLARIVRYAIERHRATQALEQHRQRALYLATHDRLTQLANRALFFERCDRALLGAQRRERGVAVLFVDVDRFKELNDVLGHEFGDRVLRLVAEVLSACIRKSDTAARIGGDEFAVLLEDVEDATDATRVAREIAARLGRSQRVRGQEVFVTASIGIAVAPGDGVDCAELLRKADAAMYAVKERGRDGYAFFSEEMDATAQRHLELEGDLRSAVERGQLTCHYQAQVDAERGRVIGVEALARWRHSRLGWIGPGEFVPLAERRGLIVPLGEHVLRLACSTAVDWPDVEGVSPRVAVNVTARQLARADFGATVRRVLRETGLRPDRLELEVTESSLMVDRGAGIDALASLREEGVRVAVDDFGTGYSCLAALRRLPLDTVKIDQSFVRGALHNPADAAIIKAMLELAYQLGLNAIAEGVETRAERDFLMERGCRFMQGYLFGRPVPAAALRRLLASQRTGRRRREPSLFRAR
jgi:diguanylate cyclase (GGDEF)-like protein